MSRALKLVHMCRWKLDPRAAKGVSNVCGPLDGLEQALEATDMYVAKKYGSVTMTKLAQLAAESGKACILNGNYLATRVPGSHTISLCDPATGQTTEYDGTPIDEVLLIRICNNESISGQRWYYGTGSQNANFAYAKMRLAPEHAFYMCWEYEPAEFGSRMYSVFADGVDAALRYSDATDPLCRCFYEQIRTYQRVIPHDDLDWRFQIHSVDERKVWEAYRSFNAAMLSEWLGREFHSDDFIGTTASDDDKGSLHAFCRSHEGPIYVFANNYDDHKQFHEWRMERLFNPKTDEERAMWYDVLTYTKDEARVSVFDGKIFTKNRLMRLIGSVKWTNRFDRGRVLRRIEPYDGRPDSDFTITHLSEDRDVELIECQIRELPPKKRVRRQSTTTVTAVQPLFTELARKVFPTATAGQAKRCAGGEYIVPLKTSHCMIKQGEHSTSGASYLVISESGSVFQKCHKAACSQSKVHVLTLEPEQCRELFGDFSLDVGTAEWAERRLGETVLNCVREENGVHKLYLRRGICLTCGKEHNMHAVFDPETRILRKAIACRGEKQFDFVARVLSKESPTTAHFFPDEWISRGPELEELPDVTDTIVDKETSPKWDDVPVSQFDLERNTQLTLGA